MFKHEKIDKEPVTSLVFRCFAVDVDLFPVFPHYPLLRNQSLFHPLVQLWLRPGFVCDHNDLLAVTFKQVFSVTMLRNRT